MDDPLCFQKLAEMVFRKYHHVSLVNTGSPKNNDKDYTVAALAHATVSINTRKSSTMISAYHNHADMPESTEALLRDGDERIHAFIKLARPEVKAGYASSVNHMEQLGSKKA